MAERFYAAPLEGVTGFIWRKAHREIFGGVDKYFAPFVSPTSMGTFNTKELRDLSQNETNLVPQIITGSAENFLWAAETLGEMGYSELNLNLGCPSGTVTAKGKGAGALRDLDSLRRMLDGIYGGVGNQKISIKTRIGYEDPAEWEAILKVYQEYPVHELIIHPRVRMQQYRGVADRQLFLDTMSKTDLELVYNGDIKFVDDEAFQYDCSIMAGRGLISNPALFRMKRGGKPVSSEELVRFHDTLLEGYRSYLSGDLPVIHRMRELWHYYSENYMDADKALKKIYKAKTLAEYQSGAQKILTGCPLNR